MPDVDCPFNLRIYKKFMDHENIQKLVREILLGRKDLFARLVLEFQGPVYNLALRMTGSRSEAGDLTQEIFVRAWLNLDKYDPEKKFFTWLYTLSLNLIRNHLKKTPPGPAGHYLPEQDRAEDSPLADPVKAFNQKLREEDLQRLLLKLPVEQREALLLRFFKDVSYAEMAAILGVSGSCAKMRVRRGLVRLRDLGYEQRL